MRKPLSIMIAALVAAGIPSEASAGKITNLIVGVGIGAPFLAKLCIKNQVCRAGGAELAAKSATGIIENYGPGLVAKCVASPACFTGLMAAMAAGKTVIPSLSLPPVKSAPGDGMMPPGDCGPGELGRLTANVERFCKKERPTKCTRSDGRVVLEEKLDILQECLSARSRRETQCFRGGDRTHRTEIQNTKNQMNNCYSNLAKQQ